MATVGTTSRPSYVYDQETDTWVPVGVGPHTHENFVTATTIDAKGDLLAGSAPDTVGKLTVGANGTMLVADSTQTLGMAWSNTITIASGSTVPLTIQNNGTGNSFVVNDVASDTTPFVITSDGLILSGSSTAYNAIGGYQPGISNFAQSGTVGQYRYSADTAGTELSFNKSRSGTLGSQSAVTTNDALSIIRFAGSDGTSFSEAVRIVGAVDGAVSTGIVPGRFIVQTESTAGVLTERMRINSEGTVTLDNNTATVYGSYVMPNTDNSGLTWTKIGRFVAGNFGNHIKITLVGHTGFNANPSQSQSANIYFKTGNGGSLDANGFAGDGYYVIDSGQSGFCTEVKVVGNAAGLSATAFDFYIKTSSYTFNSFYTVEMAPSSRWDSSGATAVNADPGVGSSTVCVLSNATNLANLQQYGGGYILTMGDGGRLLEFVSGGNITIPTYANVPFMYGTQINILQGSSGQLTVVGASGVTVVGSPGVKTRGIWSSATLINRGTNNWVVVGDLVP